MGTGRNGITVARDFYSGLVEPLLQAHLPSVRYAAARLGTGSEVLGLDDSISQDHDWGLRLTLLVDAPWVNEVDALFTASLPERFAGHLVRLPATWDAQDAHRIEITTPREFLLARLGLDPSGPLKWRDWLTLTGQAVLEVTAGEVFRDDDGTLTAAREALTWYPDDVWRLVVAVAWRHLAEDVPVLGRLATRGDWLGARILAGRVCEDLIRLAFLLQRRWAPWSKWLTTAFAALPGTTVLSAELEEILSCTSWAAMRVAITEATDVLNQLQATAGLPTTKAPLQPFFDRPYDGITDSAMTVLLAAIADEEIQRLPIRSILGPIDQWCRDEALLSDPVRRADLARQSLAPR